MMSRPYFSHFDDSHNRIHVGSVAVNQASSVMNYSGYFRDVFLEKAEGVGVGDHDACHFIIHQVFDRLY